jgi:hypothetical protein
MEDMADAADVPFVASIAWGRGALTAAIGSSLLEGHGPARCGFFRAAVAFHPPTSLAAGIEILFD